METFTQDYTVFVTCKDGKRRAVNSEPVSEQTARDMVTGYNALHTDTRAEMEPAK